MGARHLARQRADLCSFLAGRPCVAWQHAACPAPPAALPPSVSPGHAAPRVCRGRSRPARIGRNWGLAQGLLRAPADSSAGVTQPCKHFGKFQKAYNWRASAARPRDSDDGSQFQGGRGRAALVQGTHMHGPWGTRDGRPRAPAAVWQSDTRGVGAAHTGSRAGGMRWGCQLLSEATAAGSGASPKLETGARRRPDKAAAGPSVGQGH